MSVPVVGVSPLMPVPVAGVSPLMSVPVTQVSQLMKACVATMSWFSLTVLHFITQDSYQFDISHVAMSLYSVTGHIGAIPAVVQLCASEVLYSLILYIFSLLALTQCYAVARGVSIAST